jgi:hypothetical protein
MISKIKEYFWVVVLGIAIVGVAILFRDMDQVEEMKALLRRKRVQDDVDEIKRTMADDNHEVTKNDEKLVELAEKMRQEKKKVKDASPEEIKEFYDGFFG